MGHGSADTDLSDLSAFEVGGTKVATLGTANLGMENSVGQTAGVSDQSDVSPPAVGFLSIAWLCLPWNGFDLNWSRGRYYVGQWLEGKQHGTGSFLALGGWD